MGSVISLSQYRHRSRKAYLAKFGGRIDRLVEKFVRSNVDVDFRQLAHDHQSGVRGADSEPTWDYVQFRETLAEAIDAAFGDCLYKVMLGQPWFDPRLVTRDEISERCLTAFIMAGCQSAIIS